MEIILPIDKNPIVDTYSYHANIVSIVSNHSQLKPWIYQRFLRLTYCKDNQYLDFCDGDYFDYYKCNIMYVNGNKYLAEYRNNPFLNQDDVTKEIATESMCKFVVECIDNKSYLIMHLDHYYIKNSDAYQNFHRVHESIIYGYNKEKKVFYLSDNLNVGKYMSTEVSFTDLELARRSAEAIDLKRVLKVSVIEDADVPINTSEVYGKLKDYLDGKDRSSHGIITESLGHKYYYKDFEYDWHWHEYTNDEMFVYGIDVHKFFIEDIKRTISEKTFIDLRRYQALLNHKAILKGLVNLMIENSLISDREQLKSKLTEIEKRSYIARSVAIKYNINFNMELLDNLILFHEKAIKSEREIIEEIMQHISSN